MNDTAFPVPHAPSFYVLGLCRDVIGQSSIPFECFSTRALGEWKVIQCGTKEGGQDRSISVGKNWKSMRV